MQPKIAACLIVKDAEPLLERALASVRPHVDGVFVYDTGSTDGTLELLERLNGERLFVDEHGKPVEDASATEVPLAPVHVAEGGWRGEWEPVGEVPGPEATDAERGEWAAKQEEFGFAWARQQNWDAVPDGYDWMLWLDDDDVLEGAHNLRMLAANAQADVDGFVVYYDYARDPMGNCVCQLWRERLVRRSAGYRWQGAVHEVLVPPEGQEARFMTVPPQMVRYVHERPDERYASDRNLKILEATAQREAAEHGGPLPRTLAYLGTEWMAKGQFDRAVGYLEAYLQHPHSAWSDERAQVRHKLAICLRVMASPQAAVHVEFEGIKERDDWTENLVGLAGAFAEVGEWKRAEEWAKRALAAGMPQSPLILNPMEHQLMPLLILADASLAQNKYDEARQAAQLAVERFPVPEVQGKRAAVEQQSMRAEIIGAVMMLRETLVRHDENLKAWSLMNAVPYLVESDPLIVRARAAQREDVLHALEPREYRRWYEDVPKESTVPDEHVEDVGDYIERARFTLEGLREQEEDLGRKPRALDMGGNDMWLACYLWKQGGYAVDGVELNKQSVEKGHERMARFGAPGRLVQGDLHRASRLLSSNGSAPEYDAVLMYEVIEHVPDPDAALAACEAVCAPGGRVYVTTPAGAFERGAIDRWAAVERKGHLRALTPSQLAEMLSRRGAIDDYRIHHADGRLTFARYRPGAPRGDVVFYAGGSFETWSPAQIRAADDEGRVGLGGSETALAQVATRLAARGWRVRVYSGADEGLYGGALYLPYASWDPTERCDLLVVSRMPHVFDNPLGARRTALWCHDHSYPGLMTEERAARVDSVVCLSEWQLERFRRLYPFAADRLVLIRNGIQFFEWEPGASGTVDVRYPRGDRGFSRRAPRVVYSSSADRGLDVMLACWPRIRERAPKAELHVYYGFDVLERVAQANHAPELLALRNQLLRAAEELGGEAGGVHLRGRLGQLELAREFQKARVWAYPTAFLETSCITAMEARAAGLAIVASDLGALAETVGEHGVLVPWSDDEDFPQNRTEEYQDRFVEAVAGALTSSKAWGVLHARSLDASGENDWERRVDAWEALCAAPRRRRKKAAAAAA